MFQKREENIGEKVGNKRKERTRKKTEYGERRENKERKRRENMDRERERENKMQGWSVIV